MNRPRAERRALQTGHQATRCGSRSLCGRLGRATGLTAGLAATAGLAFAQEGDATSRAFTIAPRVGISQTWTDNNKLQATDKDAALITTVSPGLHIASNTARLRGTLDYSLNGVLYVKSDEKNRIQQTMSAQGVAELLERTMFVDLRAQIAQQATSAFGPQTIDSNLGNPNRTEVATLSVSPYLRGLLAGLIDYEVRTNLSESRAKDTLVGDSRNVGGSVTLQSQAGRLLRWSGSASTMKTSFRTGTDVRNDSVNIGLTYRPDVDIQVGVNGGRERNDYLGGSQREGASYGANMLWTPTERTQVSADWQHHTYGSSHTLNLEHRMARSAWRFSDTRNISLGGQNGSAGLNSNYELFMLQYAGVVPDPVQRDAFVRALLQVLGLSADLPATAGFLNSTPSMLRSQSLSFSLQGLRTTMTAMLSRNSTRRLSASNLPSTGDLALSENIMQRGASVNLSHRLTPDDSVSLALTQQDTRGDLASQSTTLRSISGTWSVRLGPRTQASLGGRHARSSGIQSYRENAVLANLVQQF